MKNSVVLRVQSGQFGRGVRIGWYVRHTAEHLVLYDGRLRAVPLHTISSVEEISELPAGECIADWIER